MIITKLFFIISLFCCSWNCFAQDIVTPNVGEGAMIASLREAIDSNDLISSSQYKIIIGAGISGAEAFKNQSNLNEIHLLLTWQWLDNLKYIDSNTIVVVPRHAIDERFEVLKDKGIKLISISGVLHQKTRSKLHNEPVDKINPLTRYIVMLAGDTQREDGEWVKYDREMLKELLEFLPREQNILILNGPRTGKYLEDTNKIHVNAHKTETDYITSAVQKENVQKWQVVDFKYGQKSLWDAALHFCMIYPKVGLILPGESTSMISEALSLGILPIIYVHAAMTPTSYKYIEILKNEGRILGYPKGLNTLYYAQDPIENQIEKIVRSLISFMNR